jgi:hypothetical protein
MPFPSQKTDAITCQFISWLLLSLEPSYHVLSIAIWIAVLFQGYSSGTRFHTEFWIRILDTHSISYFRQFQSSVFQNHIVYVR